MTPKQSSKLLIEESPLQLLPTLAATIGLNEAIFLQQLQYWLKMSKHEHDDRKWIYNSIPEWLKQFPFWSESTLKRIVFSLRDDMKIILTRSDLNKENFDRTLWYAIDYDALDALIPTPPSGQNEPTMVSDRTDGKGQDEPSNTNRILQENTTETTTPLSSSPRSARGKKKEGAAPPHPMTNAIKDAYVKAVGHKLPPSAYTRVAPDAKFAAQQGVTPEEIEHAYAIMKLEDYWTDKTIPLRLVLDRIANTKETMRNRREASNGEDDDNGGWGAEELVAIKAARDAGDHELAGRIIREGNQRWKERMSQVQGRGLDDRRT